MSNTHSTLTALFSDIADSIRSKAGTSAPIIADAFPAAIDAIPSGGGGDITWDNIAMGTISGNASGSATQIRNNAFQSCSALTTANFPMCSTIGAFAFQGCSALTTANFPICTTIGSSAFDNCRSLTTVSFPMCGTIRAYAFYICSSLTTASFPICTTIGSNAFYSCPSLTTASFPHCVAISSSAFNKCYKLLSLYLLGSSIPQLTLNALSSTPISNYGTVRGSIIVQASMLEAFQTATNWSVYSSRFSVWNGID